MRRCAWFVLLGAATIFGAVGCGDDDGDGDIMIDASMPDDGGGSADGGDSGVRPDSGPVMCGAVGRVGGSCREGMCLETSLQCLTEIRPMGAALTSASFEIPQADPEDPTAENPETFVERATRVPADNVPVTFATQSLCTQQCDTTAAADMCGACALCSDDLGYNVLGAIGVRPVIFFQETQRAYGADTGICRARCTFDPATNGGCPAGHTCDPFSNTCLEACRNDAQCNGTVVLAESGNIATWVNPAGGQTCNATTGRCEWTNPATSTVGDECDSNTDCTAGVGFCLAGAACAELECGRASDTATDGTFICDGGRGVCIGIGGNNASVCAPGCSSPDDCAPGLGCIPRDEPHGAFSGFCWPTCGGSGNVPCGNGERCDLSNARPETPTAGRCAPSCDPADADSCGDNAVCQVVAGSSPAYGFCRELGSFCSQDQRAGSLSSGTERCFGGQVCNGLLGNADLGRCIEPCTEDSCTGENEECVESETSILNGLCAIPCTRENAATTCGTTRTCYVPTGADSGHCIRRP